MGVPVILQVFCHERVKSVEDIVIRTWWWCRRKSQGGRERLYKISEKPGTKNGIIVGRMTLIKEAWMDRIESKNLLFFAVMLSFSLSSSVSLGPDVQHRGFCWFRDHHHLSVLPGKWLNRALWRTINNNLRPFSPLCFHVFRTLRAQEAAGPEQTAKTLW